MIEWLDLSAPGPPSTLRPFDMRESLDIQSHGNASRSVAQHGTFRRENTFSFLLFPLVNRIMHKCIKLMR